MRHLRELPSRERVFIISLRYHGFRLTRKRHNLKYRRGYVIPSTWKEDADGIDLWVKMPRDDRLFPIQITQRGVRIYRKYHKPTGERVEDFIRRSTERVRAKQVRCRQHSIAFTLVRDFDGKASNPQIAWGDIKALRYAIQHLRRWL